MKAPRGRSSKIKQEDWSQRHATSHEEDQESGGISVSTLFTPEAKTTAALGSIIGARAKEREKLQQRAQAQEEAACRRHQDTHDFRIGLLSTLKAIADLCDRRLVRSQTCARLVKHNVALRELSLHRRFGPKP